MSWPGDRGALAEHWRVSAQLDALLKAQARRRDQHDEERSLAALSRALGGNRPYPAPPPSPVQEDEESRDLRGLEERLRQLATDVLSGILLDGITERPSSVAMSFWQGRLTSVVVSVVAEDVPLAHAEILALLSAKYGPSKNDVSGPSWREGPTMIRALPGAGAVHIEYVDSQESLRRINAGAPVEVDERELEKL